MFEDQKIEFLPMRTTMKRWSPTIVSQNFNVATAVAVNAGNVNVGGHQANIAAAAAAAGSNFFG
jgi:hypothetical protein